MDDRQINPKTRRRQPEVDLSRPILYQGFYMVGRREHETLIAEGHYRCPHCRRADTLENVPVIHGG
jgi:hypothetical protein